MKHNSACMLKPIYTMAASHINLKQQFIMLMYFSPGSINMQPEKN